MQNQSPSPISRRQWLSALTATSAGSAILAAGGSAIAAEMTPETHSLAGARVYNIREFGAKGDGTTLDTAALQAAIDACHRDKGGIVLVPAGVFVIGTTELKSNVTLHLAAQATLLGSGDGRHYHAAEAIPTRDGPGEWTMGDGNVAMLFAANAENVCIEGRGTIDGNGSQFRPPTRGAQPPAGLSGNRRPHHLIFYKCTRLTVNDIFLRACAYHSIRVCACRHVKMDGVRIHNRVNHNNDGFHFISSEHVHVSNCNVFCQDDACALFGSNKFVTVTNCTFSTRWSVFRFGGGHSENITVSNCLIYETYGCPIKMRCDHRSHYENISFSNLVMKDVTGPISIGLGPQRPQPGVPPPAPGIVRNISFNNIRATVARPQPLADVPFISNYNPGEMFSCIILNGMDEGFIENVSFNDVHVTFPGGGTAEHGAVRDVPKVASEYYVIGIPPAHGLFARNVRGLTLNNVRFELAAPDQRPALILDNVSDAAVNGLSVAGDEQAESALRMIACRDVLVSQPRLRTAAAVFLQVEDAASRNIVVDGGDVSKAENPLALKAGAENTAVRLRG